MVDNWLNYVWIVAILVSVGLQIRGRQLQREGQPVPKWISYTILLMTAVIMASLVYAWFFAD